MNNGLKSGLRWSTFLHIAPVIIFLLLGLLRGGDGGEPTSGGDEQDRKQIVAKAGDKDEWIEVTLVGIPKEAEKKTKEKECKDWFGGIGITWNIQNSSVIEAFEGYPAYNAGLRAGDIIYTNGDFRGEPGTEVVINVMRNRNIFTVTLIRGKICIKDFE